MLEKIEAKNKVQMTTDVVPNWKKGRLAFLHINC
jgi:hypothetical protein